MTSTQVYMCAHLCSHVRTHSMLAAVLTRLGLWLGVAGGSYMKRRKLPWTQPQPHSDAGVGADRVFLPVGTHEGEAPSQPVQDAAVPQVIVLDSDDAAVAQQAATCRRGKRKGTRSCSDNSSNDIVAYYASQLRPLIVQRQEQLQRQ